MGACCAKKQDREAGIKYQIERTVVEQQKIRQEEEEEEQQIQIQCQSPSSRSKMMEMEVQNQAEIYNLVTQAGGDEVQEKQEPKKSEKTKKKRTETKAEDSNYLRKIDHKLGIKSLVVEMVIEGEMKYYKISILVEYKEFSFSLSLNGTLTTQQDFNYITISPQSYTQASKYSRFLTFFSNDNYFSADKDCVNQFNSFDKLLNVVRSLQELKMNNKRIQRRHTTVIKDSKNDDKLLVETKNHEMLEIITIVDIEYQSRFLNLLFHLLVQKYFKQLEQNLVFITNTTFLFEKPPQFDQPNVYKLALFYDNLDYSLNDLAKLLIEKNLELSQYLYQKLVVNLLNIFYNCYSNFFYRLNFTLNTIFFVSKYKCFKLQSFNRLKYLLQFGVKPDISLKNVEEKKYRLYSKAFKKDLFALCDLILYFKNVNGQQFKKLQSKRKRFFSAKQDQEDVEEENYLIYVENMFTNQKEQNILEFFRLAAYSKDIKQIEKTLSDCLPIIESLQKILTEYELKLELKDISYKPTQENHTQNMNQILQEIDVQSNLSFSDKDENLKLTTFQLDFNAENENLSLNQDKLSEDKLLYKELIFQSILYQGNYSETYSKFKSCKNSSLQEKAHAEVLFAFHQAKQMNEDSWQFKLEMISQLMSRPVEIINSIFKAQLDSSFVTLLFQVLTLSNNKPLPLLNELSSCINVQLKEKLKKKKQQKIQSQTQTIIEQKKYIMLQLMFAQSYLSHFNYYQAIHKIQRVIGFQLKNSHVASLFYGYSLLVSGEIQKESLQAVSAMLNLEMGQVIYHSFFPEYVTQEVTKEKFDEQQQQQQQQQNTNTTEQANNNNTTPNQQFILTKIQNLATSNKSKLELLLGLSYFEIHDQENSLRCLKTAEQLLLRSFNMFADEVITVVLKQLEIYVLQDDIGSALKITRSYALKMAQYYKEGRLFKRKIIAKLQFVMGSVFEFNGQLISAIRFIERSNKTYNNSKCLNFVVQMHFQAKKLILIQKLKDAFIKIKSKQFVQNKIDLCVFQSLNESMSQVFLSQFYRQRVIQKSSLMMDKYGSKLIKVKSLIRIGKKQKAIKFIKKCLKKLSKNKKDEIYAIFSIHQTELQLTEQKQQAQAKIIISQIELIEMFLFFPQKDYHLINHYILLMLHYAKMNESKLIQDTYSKIQQAIDDFFEILQWKSISTKQYSNNINNKFEILMKKSKITLLYLIYAIIDLIDYFNSIKKEIFNSIFKGKNMTEESEKIRTQYQEYFRKLNQNLNERKESCLFGYCKISHKNNQNLVQNQKNQKNDQELEAQNTIKTRQSKLEIQSQNKIILDVRSVDEILISNRRKTKIQQISSIEISQPNQTLDTDVPQSANRQVTKTSSHSRHKQTSSEKNIKKPVKLNPFESTTKKSVKK